MTEQNHDEIARRLRETGMVPAPDRLRDEVMSQVRAEPRVRPSRRRFLAPVLPYAAAAAALVAAVFAISQLGGGGSGVNSGGAGASGGGIRSPEATKDAQGAASQAQLGGKAVFSLTPYAARRLSREDKVIAAQSPHAFVLRVPRPLYADYVKRLRKIERRTHGRDTIRVILKPAS